MKRIFFIIALGLLLALPTSISAKSYKSVVVTRHDGTILSIKHERGLQMNIDGENVKFFIDNDFISVPVSEVKGLSLSEKEGEITIAAVGGIAEDEISVTKIGGEILFSNLPAGTKVSVVSMSGQTMHSAVAEGNHSVDVSSYAPGVYVVTYNKKSIKLSIAK